MESQKTNKTTIIKIIACILIIGTAGFAFSRIETKKESRQTEIKEEVIIGRTYKDGVYTKTGMYTSPAGAESTEITITLKDNIVTSVDFKGQATNPRSVKYMDLFKKGYKQYVVGKSIDSIKLAVVSGSSLTPRGFTDALDQIKAEALV